MLKKILIILGVFLFFSFQFKTHTKIMSFSVDMKHQQFDSLFFEDHEFYYSSLKMRTFERYPFFEKKIKSLYKGIPINDSIEFYGCLNGNSFSFDLIDSGDLSVKTYNDNMANYKVDTLNFSKVKLKSDIISVIGFYKKKQFIIADVNRNKDFSDDIKYEYDIDFRKNPYQNIDLINNQPISEYKFEDCYKGKIQVYDRRFVIYPNRNNPFCLDSNNPNKEREYFSLLKFRDYWMGEQTIDNKKIEFYYHGYNNHYGILYVKPKEIQFKKNDESFNGQFKHYYYGNNLIDKPVKINGYYYKIDSINAPISKIYLQKVEEKKDDFGYTVGESVKNIAFKDLENNTFQLNKILGKKKFTLLEFWGTWCAPCIKMTPKLIETQNKFSSNLNIVSIAVDENCQKVKKYVAKHKLNWKFGIVPFNRSWENPIIKQLHIEGYPTFLLLDSKGKIVSRGGTDTFDDMIKLIE
jgi:thiol-disulfide isomerase/thioredoxin